MNKNPIIAEFQDINFKLCVIQELMYNQGILLPKFDIKEFVKNYKKRKINIQKEGHKIIPEVLDYFQELEIPVDLLKNVTKIYQFGKIYSQICPFWSGEDNQFDITNTADALLLPNLKKMTIFYNEDSSIIDQLRALNIEAEYL